MSIKFLVLGGGVFWVWGGGGGKCRFYFYGRADFSEFWGSNSGKRKTYTGTSHPPFFKKGHAMGKKMAGTNEFAFFFRCRSICTGGGPESGRKINRKMPSGRYAGTKIYFSSNWDEVDGGDADGGERLLCGFCV